MLVSVYNKDIHWVFSLYKACASILQYKDECDMILPSGTVRGGKTPQQSFQHNVMRSVIEMCVYSYVGI